MPLRPNSRPRKERLVKLNDSPAPQSTRRRFIDPSTSSAPAAEQKIRQWESVEEMQNAADEEDEPSFRIFEQTIGTAMLNVPSSSLRNCGVNGHILQRLERALWFVEKSPLEMKTEVFYWLSRVRDPMILRSLTDYAWKTIWALEVAEIPTPKSVLIGDLMLAAGVPLSQEQEISYIGGLFWNGRRSEATARWKDKVGVWRSSREFWNLGVRLLALDCNPEAARGTIQRMERVLGYVQYNDWIPIVMAYNHTGDSDKGREMYNIMKECAAENQVLIKTKHYDQIAMSFLDAGQPDMGLTVYKDMLFTTNTAMEQIHANAGNRPTPDVQKPRAPPPQATQPVVGDRRVEQPLPANERPVMADMPLEELKTLRPEDWDRYFYEGWMQCLLRMGRTDLVYYLVMNEIPKNGNPPDSMYFNWILRGFLEEGSIEMAENIAVAMIQESLRALKTKDFEEWAGGESDTPMPPPPPRPEDSAAVAPATLHTFSVLIQFFARRQDVRRVTAYSTLMSQCGIRPVPRVYNHLLYALYRQHDFLRFESVLTSVLAIPNLRPDLETWLVVWMAQSRRSVRYQATTGNHRNIFASMVRTLHRKTVAANPATAKLIWQSLIRSFVVVEDFHGVLIALHTGVHLWDMALDNTILREVTIGVLRARRYSKKLGPRLPIEKPQLEESVERLRQTGERLMKRKRGRLAAAAAGKAVVEGNLESLSELLTQELSKRPGYGPDVFLREIRAAKKGMGVANLVIKW